MKSSRMTTYILVAMVLGIAVGGLIHNQYRRTRPRKSCLPAYISFGSVIFLRLIKMIIAPLVFSTLVVGIAPHGRRRHGRPRRSARRCCWFVTASLVSLAARASCWSNLFAARRRHPQGLPLPDVEFRHRLRTPMTLEDFVKHVWCPDSCDPRRWRTTRSCRSSCSRCSSASPAPRWASKRKAGARRHRRAWRTSCCKITGYVMKLAPLAVFARHGGDRRRQRPRASWSSTPCSWATSTSGCSCLWVLLIVRRASCFLGPRVRRLIVLMQGAVPARLLDRQLGGRLSEDPRALERFGVTAQDLQLRAAAGLLVQPRRLDDVLHLRQRCSSRRPTTSS